MAEETPQRENFTGRARGTVVLITIMLASLLVLYLLVLVPFFTATHLARSASPDGACTIYVIDGGSGGPMAVLPSLVEYGQHVMLWRRWHLFPREVGTAKNYGDLESYPQCSVAWLGRTATITITSDEGGTDTLIINTR